VARAKAGRPRLALGNLGPVKKPSLNLAIDAAAFAAFVLLTSTGVLMRYVLPPGSGRFTTIWGLDRHDWGAIHFWISMLFMASLAAHLWVHRRWIASVVEGRPRQGSPRRVALGVVGLLALLAAAAAPFVTGVERQDRGGQHPIGRGAPRAPR
jgi:hypothetical protein